MSSFSEPHWVTTAECEQLRAHNAALTAMLIKAKRGHYSCDDGYYSCPLSTDGCDDDRKEAGVCDCGADSLNAEIDAVIRATTTG